MLGVEVWGHRRSGFMDLPLPPGDPENEGKRQKSFPEKLVLMMSCDAKYRNLLLLTMSPDTKYINLMILIVTFDDVFLC